MELQLLNHARKLGLNLQPVQQAQKLLGYDPTTPLRKKNMDRLQQIVLTESRSGDMKRTEAIVRLLAADYALRSDLISRDMNSTERQYLHETRTITAIMLRNLHIDLTKCTMDSEFIWGKKK